MGKQQSWAHRHSLAAPAPVDREVLDRVDGLEAGFDAVLDRFQARYLQMVERLKNLAAKAEPSAADAAVLRGYFPQDCDTLNHFFGMVPEPGWLRPANKKGYFAEPPAVIEAADGRVRMPRWPASSYLARVAGQDPAAAVEIAKQIPETTNPQVNVDLVNTAIAVGPAKAASLTDRLTRAASGPYLIAPDRYVDLALQLAADGQAGKAMPLLKALLALAPDDTFGVVPRIGDHEYGEALARAVPPLAAACGVAALQLWCAMLAEAIAAAYPTARRPQARGAGWTRSSADTWPARSPTCAPPWPWPSGNAAEEAGELAAAEDFFQKALKTSEVAGDRTGATQDVFRLGTLALRATRYSMAGDWFSKGLALALERHDEHDAALAYGMLGATASLTDAPDLAEQFFRRAVRIAQTIGSPPMLMEANLQSLGMMAQRRGRFDEADGWYRWLLTVQESGGNRRAVAEVCESLGEIARETGRWADALDWRMKAFEIRRNQGERAHTARNQAEIGRLLTDADAPFPARVLNDIVSRVLGPGIPVALRRAGTGGPGRARRGCSTCRADMGWPLAPSRPERRRIPGPGSETPRSG